MGRLRIYGCIVMILTLGIEIIAFASPYWISNIPAGNNTLHMGLWQTCVDECYSNTEELEYDGFIGAVQGFNCLGLIILVMCLTFMVVQAFISHEIVKYELQRNAGGMLFIGAFCTFVSLLLFGCKVDDLDFKAIDKLTVRASASDLHFAYAFGVIALAGTVIAGAMLKVDQSSESKANSYSKL